MTPVNSLNSENTILKWLSKPRPNVRYEHLVAGVSGGVISTLVLHPLDLLKIRFAVNDGQVSTRPQYRGLGNAVSTIFKEEGIRGFYRGVTPNVWGAGAAWGFYFFFYNGVKTRLEGGEVGSLGPGSHMVAASISGVLTLVMTNPIWVVKTRLCLQYNQPPVTADLSNPHSKAHSSNLNKPDPSKHYRGMLDALVKVYRYEGLAGLYKGFIPGVFGVSHGAIQFMAYEEMKKSYTNYHQLPINSKLGTLEYLTIAALSKLLAAALTYPYQVVRARLQDQNSVYKGAMDAVRKTWRAEGYRGFYKGLLPNVLRVTPATAITFVVYEHVSSFIRDKRKES